MHTLERVCSIDEGQLAGHAQTYEHKVDMCRSLATQGRTLLQECLAVAGAKSPAVAGKALRGARHC